MNIKLDKIAYYLPGNPVTNQELQKQNPDWIMDDVAKKTGVYERYFTNHDETAFDIALKACKTLFEEEGVDKNEIDGIIFCTQSPDYIMPSNSHLLHRSLELRQNVFAFDIDLACSGFVYGVAIANGFISTGLAKKVLLVTADTYSKHINKRDRSARTLFGDGAAATLLSISDDENRILNIELATSGISYQHFYIPAGGYRNPRTEKTSVETTDISGNTKSDENIHMNGFAVWKFIQSTVPVQIEESLSKLKLGIDDIDGFIFHQASKMTIDSLAKALKVNESKVHNNIHKLGNTVSASIPIALKDAINENKIKRGDLLLISGFGVGLSWGTIVLKF